MHFVTLSFDDGFKKSFLQAAEIYEQFGLSACFNVIATGHIPGQGPQDQWQLAASKGLGDFGLWNELVDRGHEIMPQGYTHIDHAVIPLEKAKQHILLCLEEFDNQLKGFDRKKAVFNFPYNAVTDELEAWLTTQVRAIRGEFSEHGISPLPSPQVKILRTTGFGPGNCQDHLDSRIDNLLKKPQGWLVYNTHGLDDEGWGPIGSDYLKRLLERLLKIDSVVIGPTGKFLTEATPPAEGL